MCRNDTQSELGAFSFESYPTIALYIKDKGRCRAEFQALERDISSVLKPIVLSHLRALRQIK